MTRWKAVLPFLMACILLAPANGQGPAAYFSISTNKTFLPGEKIGIRLYATNVDALEFTTARLPLMCSANRKMAGCLRR